MKTGTALFALCPCVLLLVGGCLGSGSAGRGSVKVHTADPTFYDNRVFLGEPRVKKSAMPPGQSLEVTRHDGNLSILHQGLVGEYGGNKPRRGQILLSYELPVTADQSAWKDVAMQVHGAFNAFSRDATATVRVKVGRVSRIVRLRGGRIENPSEAIQAGAGDGSFVISFLEIDIRGLPKSRSGASAGVLLPVEIMGIVDAGDQKAVGDGGVAPNAFLEVTSLDGTQRR